MISCIESLWLVVHQKSSIVATISLCFVRGILVEWKGLYVDCTGHVTKTNKIQVEQARIMGLPPSHFKVAKNTMLLSKVEAINGPRSLEAIYVRTTMLGSYVDTSSRKDFMGATLLLDMEAKLKMLMDVKEVIDLELKAFNFDSLVANDKKQKA
jgi:hypothetical protein